MSGHLALHPGIPPCLPSTSARIVGIAADHGGHEMKQYLAMMLREAGAQVVDFGDRQPVPEDDYPDFVVPLARAVAAGRVERGVAICGSGVGACIVANKVAGVRACLVHDTFSAHQGVEDDDLNLICLGGLVVGHALAWELVRTFLTARFSQEARHCRRLEKITCLENPPAPMALKSSIQSNRASGVSTLPLRLHILRHGETAWALSGQHTGRTDIPLTAHGEAEARALGAQLTGIPFVRVFSSPLQRARQTCALVALPPPVEIEPDLAEWDYGDYEGKCSADILSERPQWTVFQDGAPNGESTAQIGARADRLIARLRPLEGDIALFTHGHFGRVLAARWIGLTVGQSRPFLLHTASHSILCYDHEQTDEPAIELWNASAPAPKLPLPVPENQAAMTALAAQKMRSLDRWENEGGEIPLVHPPVPAPPQPASPQPAAPQPAASVFAKRLFIFDLDGTLAESKAPIDDEMAALLKTLLDRMKVAVISGGDWPQFQLQVLARLPADARLASLVLLPTCGTKYYEYASAWTRRYAESFTAEEKTRISDALTHVSEAGADGEKSWGERIEDRGTQITFSALGQHAPLAEKATWDPHFLKREKMKTTLEALIPGFSVRLGGTTSIDVTRPGIDKAYGIQKLREILGIDLGEMIFAGDAVFPGGNDYPVKAAGVASIRVHNPEETKRVIETFLASGVGAEPDARREEVAR